MMRKRGAALAGAVGWLCVVLAANAAQAACEPGGAISGSPFPAHPATGLDTQTSDNVRITGGCIDVPNLYVNGSPVTGGSAAAGITIGSTHIADGGTSTTIAGLASVGTTVLTGPGGTLDSNGFDLYSGVVNLDNGSNAYITFGAGLGDARISRSGAGTLEQIAGNNGQIWRTGYNRTDDSNFSYGVIDAGKTTANTLYVGSRHVGSPAQALTKWCLQVDDTGTACKADFNITNSSGLTLIANVFMSGLSTTPGSKQPLCIDTSTKQVYQGTAGAC